uniref:AsIV-cont00055-ORF2 n=1 Tax=Apophua simplicipes ichnovirus TaxID=1329648 RepID=S5DYV2_9VIRU|nr:AsIV-cont00055-ORF2 [Apophua simplicipes ichnovirus]
MIKNGLSPEQQAELDSIVVNLNELNAHLQYFESCGKLSFTEKIEKAVFAMKKKTQMTILRKLLRNSTNIPAHLQEALN